MKVFFDTNVYIAEALLGASAEVMLDATEKARWRIFVSGHILEEVERVMVERLGSTRRFARLTRERCRRRALMVSEPTSKHSVPEDPADSPILRAAHASGADYLVTNDAHRLKLNPHEGLRVVSMTKYFEILRNEGLM